MIIQNQCIETKITKANIYHYINKGYKCNIGDIISVDAQDLIIGSKQIVKVKCDYCGEEYTAIFKNIIRGRKNIQKDACKKCVGKKCAEITLCERQEKIYKKIVDVCKGLGYELISRIEDIKNYNTMIAYRCPKHEIQYIRVGNILSGKKCPVCAKEYAREIFSLSQETIISEIKKCGGFLLNPEEYINNSTKNLKILCPECGNPFITSYRSFVQHGGQVCKECSKKAESIGEKRIRYYLEKHNIAFEQNYWFDDCRDINPLPFDFYLINKNKIIEFDGKQHFDSNVLFKHSAEITPIHDKMKDKYCIENNIDLLRIPYWDINNIEEILDDFI